MLNKVSFKRVIYSIACAAAVFTIPTSSSNAAVNGLANDVIYSIMIDRFANGNKDNDIPLYAFPGNNDLDRKARYWLARTYYQHSETGKPTVTDIGGYWGGDLQGVIDKLDYLHWLGVTVVLLSPPFENALSVDFRPNAGGAAYHGYWVRDFMRLDPHFVNPPKARESLEDVLSRGLLLRELIEKAHSYRPPLKVLLDVPLRDGSPAHFTMTTDSLIDFSEMGALFDDGRFLSLACKPEATKTCKESFAGTGWFKPPNRDIDWDDPRTYYDGWFFAQLPALDYDSPKVADYMTRAFEKWLQLGVDGFRLDAVKYVNPAFVSTLLETLTEKYPNTIWIGEYPDGGVFEGGVLDGKVPRVSAWLEQFPQMTIYDFSFVTAARQYFSGRVDHTGTPYFLRTILDPDSPSNTLRSRRLELVNLIDSHDLPRLLSLRGATRKSFAAALRLLFISPGVPQLFYGDEIGLAYSDGSENWRYFFASDITWARLPMPWDLFDRPQAQSMLELTRSLIRLRREFPMLRTGRFELLRALNVSQVMDGTSYMAVMRSRHQVAWSDRVFFLYSASDRDRLEFDVDIPDGTYQALDSAKIVTVSGGHLVWSGIAAQDSLILVVRAP